MVRAGVVVGLVVAFVAVCLVGFPADAAVRRGSPVVARFNPDNNIVAATKAAAAATGFGPVRATGFRPDCSPMQGTLVVCRDPSLTRDAVVRSGPGTCVIATDPTFGGGPKAVRELTQAMRRCRA